MWKIISIKKSGKDKYQIEMDNNRKIKIYDNVILNNNLLFKKEIDDNLLLKIEEESNKEESYYKTVNYISKKMRSKKEILDFLDKQDIDYEEKNRIIRRLDNNRLINDNEYAMAYVQDKMLLTSDGPNKIKADLIENNIDYNTIEKCLNSINLDDVFKKAKKLIDKKVRTNSTKSQYALKQKILYDMNLLGYDNNMINEIINDSEISKDNSVVSKEFYKLYRKLSNKFQDKELSTQIYYKLRQKGFTDEEIKSINK